LAIFCIHFRDNITQLRALRQSSPRASVQPRSDRRLAIYSFRIPYCNNVFSVTLRKPNYFLMNLPEADG
jgi:hypothetical protein